MKPDMQKKLKKIMMLCALGVFLGTGLAWHQENREVTAGLAAMAPAAGDEAASENVAGGSAVGGAFSLTDQDGNAVTDQDYADSYKLVFFGFTNCPDVCPAGLKKIALTLEALGDDAAKVQPLFITVDPARDTPETMKQYAALYDERIVGLTGSDEQIKDVQKAYKVYAAKADMPEEPAHEGHGAHHGDHYTVNHSAFIYLMDRSGELVTIFRSDDTPDAMVEEIKKALTQS